MRNETKLALSRERGFSLLEMLVVIGIIGVLASVLLSQFGGATDSAKATQCMTNLRNLAVAAQNYGMATATETTAGHYPAAGSYEYVYLTGDRSIRYHQDKGWISWKTNYKGESKNRVSGTVTHFDDDETTARFALTNGALWAYCDRSISTYKCPVHVNSCRRHNGALRKHGPAWSYVMNPHFGFDQSYGGTALKRVCHKTFGSLAAPDRTLMFAELPALTSDEDPKGTVANTVTAVLKSSGNLGDSVLNYDKNEQIGFNHKAGKRFAAHVAYADGHVAKLIMPTSGDMNELVAMLCQGYSVSFNGATYRREETESGATHLHKNNLKSALKRND